MGALVSACAAGLGGAAFAEEARIAVHAREVTNAITRTMTGACIEDVNHEIYGGLYSQMIFGESFQEPAQAAPIKGFKAYGSGWRLRGDEAWSDDSPGPKLVSDFPAFKDGEVGVEVFFPGPKPGLGGLIVRVTEPGVGADKFSGYEVALGAGGHLVVHRHRQNWEPIKTFPCAAPTEKWIPLVVRMSGPTMQVLVGGSTVATVEDKEHPLLEGAVGLRPFGRETHFRNLYVKIGDKTTPLAFELAAPTDLGQVSGMWRPVRRGDASGRFTYETEGAFVGKQSQRITLERSQGELGVENQGLNRWGMCFREGKPYEGYLWVRAEKAMDVHVAMESRDGAKTYAEARLKAAGGADWQRLDFTLTPRQGDTAGRFAVLLKTPGSVLLGHAFLQPGEWGRFKGLPCRKDVAEALIAQGLTVLRYGGSMINHNEYRWKKMIGPRDRRPPYQGTWYPYSTHGWGILDFLNLCEAAGFLGIPALNMDETPEDMADFIEYVNGRAESLWGKMRAADGHPEPYRLKYVELGNEERVDEKYFEKFKALAEAIWAKDPAVVPVVGDWMYGARIEDPMSFKGSNITSLAAHKQILEFAKARGKAVWFDVHVGNDGPRDPDAPGGGFIGLRDFIAALKKLCPGADFKAPVFEENAGNHAMRRALGHAHAMNELERMGDSVPIDCAANCLQCDGQNDNGWDQGMLFLNPSQVWPQPPYYVTQMISRNWLPKVVKAEVESPADALDATAKVSEDGKVLTLQVVNMEEKAMPARIVLDGFAPLRPVAKTWELAGKPNDINTAAQPDRIKPKEGQWRHDLKGEAASYTFPPYSFTLLRFE